jgi:general secretion pathway protein L
MASSHHLSSSSRPLLGQIGAGLSSLARWWIGEFLALFPTRIAQTLVDAGDRNLLIRPGEAEIEFMLRNGSGTPLARTKLPSTVDVRTAIEAILRDRKLTAKLVVIGIELPAEELFRRQILLPKEAHASIPAIAAQDLLRKTPFRLDDVYHDYAARPSGQKILVSQAVILRTLVEKAASGLGLRPDELSFVESAPSADGEQPFRVRLHPIKPQASWLPKAFAGLTVTSLLLLGLAPMLESQRQQAVLEELSAQLTKARAQAQQVRATLDKAQQERSTLDNLRARKWEAANTLDIWEEMSRVLPDESWVSELRISESPDRKDRKVVVTGFSSAAADLVAIIDKSPLFQDVAVTAPIVIDPAEQRERFVLQAVVSPNIGGAQR